ncbi:MAG: hypothetical protein AVDCRST_MAG70-2087, partial [uncultured Thermomicrobiales bacterium]
VPGRLPYPRRPGPTPYPAYPLPPDTFRHHVPGRGRFPAREGDPV